MREQAAAARDSLILTADQYYAEAVKHEAEQRAKQAQREAADKAAQEADAAYLASLPELAEVCEASEFLLLTKLRHWFSLGYLLAEDSIQFFNAGCYVVRLHKPTAAKCSK